jgi:hypothetical protein
MQGAAIELRARSDKMNVGTVEKYSTSLEAMAQRSFIQSSHKVLRNETSFQLNCMIREKSATNRYVHLVIPMQCNQTYLLEIGIYCLCNTVQFR